MLKFLMMSDRELPWLPQEPAITTEEWDTFAEQYTAELGFDAEPHPEEYFQEGEIFTRESPFLGDHNWPLLMPENSVTRIVEAEHPYEMFKSVVQETAENELGDTKPKSHDLKLVSNHIIPRLRGSNDFQPSLVRDDDYKPSNDSGYTVPDELSIVVTSTNSRNYQDWYVYDISNATELFGSTLDSMTQAAHAIYKADLKPDKILRDVALWLRSGGMETKSVPDATPPQHSVTIVSTGLDGDGLFYKINSPEEAFGSKWANTRLMQSSIDIEPTGDIGSIFWINTGINL